MSGTKPLGYYDQQQAYLAQGLTFEELPRFYRASKDELDNREAADRANGSFEAELEPGNLRSDEEIQASVKARILRVRNSRTEFTATGEAAEE